MSLMFVTQITKYFDRGWKQTQTYRIMGSVEEQVAYMNRCLVGLDPTHPDSKSDVGFKFPAPTVPITKEQNADSKAK